MSVPGTSRAAARWLPDIPLLFILLFAIYLRSQYLTLPMAEAHRWREVTNADIARNFYERSMNLFYPQVNWGGAQQPYVGMEFPLLQYIAALLYYPFGESAVIGRLISMAFSIGTAIVIFAIGRRLFGVAAGRAAAFLFAISPSAVFFGRFFISDTPMVFFSAGGGARLDRLLRHRIAARVRGGVRLHRSRRTREAPRRHDPGADRVGGLGSEGLEGAEGSRADDRYIRRRRLHRALVLARRLHLSPYRSE
jgi:hypothetical protein